MTPPLFPTLSGQAWPITRRPLWSTRIAQHVSGREVRAQTWSWPLWEFGVDFSYLPEGTDLQTICDFFMGLAGQCGEFLYLDPVFGQAVAQRIAIGDGVSTAFLLTRPGDTIGEPAGWVGPAPTAVLVGGSPVSGSLLMPNVLLLPSPPPKGAPIVASYTAYFVCRLLGDQAQWENFGVSFHRWKGVKFRSVKPNTSLVGGLL